MKAAESSEMSLRFYQARRRHVPKDGDMKAVPFLILQFPLMWTIHPQRGGKFTLKEISSLRDTMSYTPRWIPHWEVPTSNAFKNKYFALRTQAYLGLLQ